MTFSDFTAWFAKLRKAPGEENSPDSIGESPPLEDLSQKLLPSILNAADKLISSPSLDLVYRSVVELARDALGLERARLYIFTVDQHRLIRTYGTNLAGEVVPEGADPKPLDNDWQKFLPVRNSRGKRWVLREEMRTWWNGTADVPCGQGWVAYTVLQTGLNAIGVLCHDSAISNQPHDSERQDLLTVFCSLAASVIDRKKNELALRQNEIKFRHIYERSLVMMHITDQHGKIIDTNAKFLEHTGFRRDEVLGKNLELLIIELTGEQTRAELFADLWTHGRVTEARFAYKKKNGDLMQVHLDCSVATNPEGQPIVLSVVRDITQELAVQVAIQESREMLQLVIDSIPQYIFWKDRNHRYLGCNAHFARLVEIKDHQAVLGQTDKDLPWLKPYDEEFRLVDERVMKTGRIEVQIARRKLLGPGRGSWVESTRVPLRNTKGEVVGLLGAFADVSEQQSLQEERARTSKLESIGVLAGGISHDFNNILTTISGNISMIAAQTAYDDENQDYLQEAQVACRQAHELAGQLLAFSKGEVPSKKPTNPDRFLRQAVQFSLRGSALAAIWKIDDQLPLIEIDESQMRQVVHHLILNAVKAQESGRIIVNCAKAVIQEGEAGPLPTGNYVKFSITDFGCGISPQDLGKIFDPYFSTKPEATGLGLSTCYFIVRKHGGALTVESEVGKGTTFTVTLPVCTSRTTTNTGKLEKAKRGGGRVLFLDDEVQIRTLTERILKALGYDVTTAADGEEAIRLYRAAIEAKKPFKFLITDLTLPGGMNGVKVYAKIRELYGDIPAILISGYSDDPITRAFADYGFKALLSKPYDLDQVTETLERLELLQAAT